jgi:hypothetical protein
MPLRKFKDGDFVFSISEEEEKKFCSGEYSSSPSSLSSFSVLNFLLRRLFFISFLFFSPVECFHNEIAGYT